MRGFLLLFILSFSQSIQADSVSFGGSCASQGSWTSRALQQTQEISDVIKGLRNDPACKAFLKQDTNALENFQQLEKTLADSEQNFTGDEGTPAPDDEKRQSWETLPSELANLRTYFLSGASVMPSFWDVLMGKTIESGTSNAGGAGQAIPQSFKSMGQRLSRSGKLGLTQLNHVLTAIPSLDECLLGAPDMGAKLFSTVVDMAAAFASSDATTATQIGQSISHIVNVMRERRYTPIIRKIKKAQFINSISCLLESTTHVYCTTNEAIELFNMGFDKKWARIDSEKTSSPLEGYFILNREAKIVTDWIAKVNRGIEPKWKTDAQFKNEAVRSVLTYIETSNNVLGQFNEGWFNIMKQKDLKEQQNFLYKAIEELVAEILAETPGTINFFTAGTNPNLIPYYLIGYDNIPKIGYGKQGLLDWKEVFQSYGPNQSFLKEFQDPHKLAMTVKERLLKLSDRANAAATTNYVERVIIDHALLVNESLTPNNLQNLTVIEGFKHINQYLEKLKQRIISSGEENLFVHTITDTQNKIRRILEAFDAVRKSQINSEVNSDEIRQKFRGIIETVFTELNMLLQREGLIMNRLINFVTYDYSLRVRSGENMSKFQRELQIVSGTELMERIQAVYEKEPAKIEQDLSNAQATINQTNLRSLEDLFGDVFFSILEEYKIWDENPHATTLDLKSAQLLRRARDANRGAYQGLKKYLFEGGSTRERYGFDEKWEGQPLGSDLAKQVHTMRGKFCIQSLAFERGHRYAEFCKGVVLEGKADVNDSRSLKELDLNADYDAILASSKLDKPYSWMGIKGLDYEANMPRKCAFRNYLRKNQVYWMTQKINSDK